mmetsp:Transcript_10334/g.26007  ORF Transcript_10334/g.26007 Transcript_10334/m.26007 type:complete len:83 (-) Transcript_10334:36-284(-)
MVTPRGKWTASANPRKTVLSSTEILLLVLCVYSIDAVAKRRYDIDWTIAALAQAPMPTISVVTLQLDQRHKNWRVQEGSQSK